MTLWQCLENPDFWYQLVTQWLLLGLLGLAFLLTYQAGYVNLGISAQLICGAFAACYVGAWTSSHILAVLACILATTVVGLLPVILRCYCESNEILTTLFMSYAAVSLGAFVIAVSGEGATTTARAPQVNAWFIGEYFSVFHLMAIPAMFLAWLYLKHSVFGYKLRVLESGPNVFSTPWQKLLVLGVSSVFAAFLVALVVLGDTYFLEGVYKPGEYDAMGFLSVAVALLALKRPLLIWVGAVIVGSIQRVSMTLSLAYKVPEMASANLLGLGIVATAIILRVEWASFRTKR